MANGGYVRFQAGKIIDANPGTAGSRASWERVPEGPKPEGPPMYTPTTQEVRDWYAKGSDYRTDRRKRWVKLAFARFDRWLAEHDRQVAERAWDEGNRAHPKFAVNPYRAKSTA